MTTYNVEVREYNTHLLSVEANNETEARELALDTVEQNPRDHLYDNDMEVTDIEEEELTKYKIRIRYTEIYEIETKGTDVHDAVSTVLSSSWEDSPTMDEYIEEIKFSRIGESGVEKFEEYDGGTEYDEE